jgi:hypothetical protein
LEPIVDAASPVRTNFLIRTAPEVCNRPTTRDQLREHFVSEQSANIVVLIHVGRVVMR